MRRSHQEILKEPDKPSGIGGVGSFNKDMLESVAQKLNRTNSKLLRKRGPEPEEKRASYGVGGPSGNRRSSGASRNAALRP